MLTTFPFESRNLIRLASLRAHQNQLPVAAKVAYEVPAVL